MSAVTVTPSGMGKSVTITDCHSNSVTLIVLNESGIAKTVTVTAVTLTADHCIKDLESYSYHIKQFISIHISKICTHMWSVSFIVGLLWVSPSFDEEFDNVRVIPSNMM